MAVKTKMMTVDAGWVQATDGNQTKTIQVLKGAIRIVDADSNPGSAFWQGQMLTDTDADPWMTITPPTIAWIRNASTDGETAEIAIS